MVFIKSTCYSLYLILCRLFMIFLKHVFLCSIIIFVTLVIDVINTFIFMLIKDYRHDAWLLRNVRLTPSEFEPHFSYYLTWRHSIGHIYELVFDSAQNMWLYDHFSKRWNECIDVTHMVKRGILRLNEWIMSISERRSITSIIVSWWREMDLELFSSYEAFFTGFGIGTLLLCGMITIILGVNWCLTYIAKKQNKPRETFRLTFDAFFVNDDPHNEARFKTRKPYHWHLGDKSKRWIKKPP
jgi:hypothetical protein